MAVFRVIKKFKSILSFHQKFRIGELIILMVIGGILEMLSVALVMAFINLMMTPQNIMQREYVIRVCNFFDIENQDTFLLISAIGMAGIYLFKNIYLLFEYSIQYRFVYGNMLITQQKLLTGFINKPYEYFFNINSGEILRIITSDTLNAFVLLSVILNMFTEIVVSVMLITAIFLITPITTICITAVLVILLLLINLFLKPILNKAGNENQQASMEINKWVLQSIEGIKEIKIAGKESFFQENFRKNGIKYVKTVQQHQVLGMTPRFLIEAVTMSTLFIVIAFIIYYGGKLDNVLPVLSAVAMAAIRLLPSINRISTALAAISYHEPMLDRMITSLNDAGKGEKIKEDLDSSINTTDVNITRRNLERGEIQLENITFRYPNTESDIVIHASMSIKEGDSIGIVGASGAGKTTVVDIILGLLNPQKGRVLVNNYDIKNNIINWHDQIGYIPQAIFMLTASIRENIAFGIRKEDISEDDIWSALHEASLYNFVTNLPEGLDTQIGERGIRLSGGQRQRIGIARALYKNPAVLVFDEATSALDQDTESTIMESIYKLKGKRTIIIIAHRLSTIEACDHVYRIENSRIIQER